MIENAAILFANDVAKFAPDLALRPEIEAELAPYTTMATSAGNQIITQSRSTASYADLGIALIVAMFA